VIGAPESGRSFIFDFERHFDEVWDKAVLQNRPHERPLPPQAVIPNRINGCGCTRKIGGKQSDRLREGE
jgi:hypothetical protein